MAWAMFLPPHRMFHPKNRKIQESSDGSQVSEGQSSEVFYLPFQQTNSMSDSKTIPEGWIETVLGKIPSHWNIIKAQDYCLKVADGTHDSPKQSDEGKLLITSKNIKDWRLDTASAYKISIEDFEEVNKRSRVDRWDILLSMIWTVGEICLIPEEPDFAIKNVGLFKCGDEWKAKWLYYFLRSKNGKSHLLSRLSWTTQKYITLGELRDFPILFPPLPEQQTIARMLSSFDDKIELLREQNETLEKTAQTIFSEWFGKYSPERPEELPEGWRVGKIWTEFDITIWRTPPRIEQEWFSETPTGKKWISIKDIGKSGLYIFETSEYLTDEAIKKFNIPVIPTNTTILSFKMTVGKLGITTEEMLSNEAIAHLKIRNGSLLSSEYIYCYLQKLDFNSLWSTSSIVTAINSSMIKELNVLVPNNESLTRFNQHIRTIFEKIHCNLTQMDTLSNTRDTLLPKLMNGEVRV